MAFTEVFNDDVAVTVGNPTKASEFNSVSNNTDALKERFLIGHHFNNTGDDDEDGLHKAISAMIDDAAGASTKVMLDTAWNPASGTAADNQIVRWRVQMDNDAGTPEQTIGGALDWKMTDVSNGTEDCELDTYIMVAGTLTKIATVDSGGIDLASGKEFSVNGTALSGKLACSFMVAHTAGATNVTGDATRYDVVMVEVDPDGTSPVLHDTGGNFSTPSFTAPVAGKYLFVVNAAMTGLTSSHSIIQVKIVTSDQDYQSNDGKSDPVDVGFRTSFSVIADMDASDTAKVEVFVYGGAKVVDLSSTVMINNFSGCLLEAT